jgi:ankyrin repeat protein
VSSASSLHHCMSRIHAYFASRNQLAFQRLLDSNVEPRQSLFAPGLSSSTGRSSTRSSSSCDVNARDRMGRTVLHIACASLDPSAIDYVRLLLAHPALNVNLSDTESHWTALHRALYHGNIPAAYVMSLVLMSSDSETVTQNFTAPTTRFGCVLEGPRGIFRFRSLQFYVGWYTAIENRYRPGRTVYMGHESVRTYFFFLNMC